MTRGSVAKKVRLEQGRPVSAAQQMTRLERAEEGLLKATGAYLDALGWNPLVAGVTGIATCPEKHNFVLVTKFTGSEPKPKTREVSGRRNAQCRRAGKKAAASPAVRQKFGIPEGAKLKDKIDAIGKRYK